MFPNFIIAGAPKCGTTSLFHQLGDHPDICLSEPKEPRIFSVNWKGNDPMNYPNFFSAYNNEKAIGEASGSYFSDPDVPRRIYQVNPNMKIIFIFRNPVEQIFSYYWLRVRHGHEIRPWEVAIKSDYNDPLFQFSFYYRNLSRYLKYIPVENIHIVIFEEFKNDLNAELQKIYSFLEVNPSDKAIDEAWENKGYAIKNIRLVGLIKKLRTSKAIKVALPSSIRPFGKEILKTIEHNNQKNLDAVKTNALDKEFLKGIFYQDIKNLENFLNRSLPWA